METNKMCFFRPDRPCELSCRAAFQTDDPLDPVGCVFVWLGQVMGEASEALRDTLDVRLQDEGGPPGNHGGDPGLN